MAASAGHIRSSRSTPDANADNPTASVVLRAVPAGDDPEIVEEILTSDAGDARMAALVSLMSDLDEPCTPNATDLATLRAAQRQIRDTLRELEPPIEGDALDSHTLRAVREMIEQSKIFGTVEDERRNSVLDDLLERTVPKPDPSMDPAEIELAIVTCDSGNEHFCTRIPNFETEPGYTWMRVAGNQWLADVHVTNVRPVDWTTGSPQ